MSDDVFVGKDLGGREHEITADLVSLYEAGTGDRNSAYREIAPALLLHSECYAFLQDWYLPNIIGNLHAKQEWELFHPMRIGDRVRTRAFVTERYRKRNRDYVVCEVLVLGSDGRVLSRSRTHQSFLAEDADGIVIDKDREKRSDRRFEIGEGRGRELSTEPRRISLEMCKAFSGPAENYHTNREMAQALGFPDVVVQGMMTLCFLSGLLTRELATGWLCGGKMAVNLVNVVWAEDTITARARVREDAPEGRHRRLALDVWCEKSDGTRVVIGSASALG